MAGEVISGSIGNPEEEHIQLTSVSYSAVRSSWEGVNENEALQWGVRPWRTSPYLYFLTHAGHFDGRPLFTVEGRTGYTLFGSENTEARLTLQLPASFRIAGSAGFDPFRLSSNEHGAAHFGVTLERVTRSHGLIPDAVFYIGFRSGLRGGSSNPRQENMVVLGLSKIW